MDYHKLFRSAEYLSAADLNGRDVRVRIERITIEDIQSDDGPKQKPVAWFVGAQKKLVLNFTNAATLAALANSNETDKWVGLDVLLFPIRTQFKGRDVEGVRIRAAGPSSPAVAPPAPSSPGPATPPDHGEELDDIPF